MLNWGCGNIIFSLAFLLFASHPQNELPNSIFWIITKAYTHMATNPYSLGSLEIGGITQQIDYVTHKSGFHFLPLPNRLGLC